MVRADLIMACFLLAYAMHSVKISTLTVLYIFIVKFNYSKLNQNTRFECMWDGLALCSFN